MSLHAELTSDSRVTCKVCGFLSTVSRPEAGEWQEEMALPSIQNIAILRALRRRGVTITEASVRRHRENHV